MRIFVTTSLIPWELFEPTWTKLTFEIMMITSRFQSKFASCCGKWKISQNSANFAIFSRKMANFAIPHMPWYIFVLGTKPCPFEHLIKLLNRNNLYQPVPSFTNLYQPVHICATPYQSVLKPISNRTCISPGFPVNVWLGTWTPHRWMR